MTKLEKTMALKVNKPQCESKLKKMIKQGVRTTPKDKDNVPF